MLSLVGPGKEGEAGEEFDHDAAHAPHVDGLRVREHPEHDLGCPVEPALYVCVHDLFVEGAAAEVRDHDPTLVLLFQQDIFRL